MMEKSKIKKHLLLIMSVLMLSTTVNITALAKDIDGYEVSKPEYSDAYLDYLNDIKHGVSHDKDGFVPYPYKINGTSLKQSRLQSNGEFYFEEEYDPRDTDSVSEIRNQNPWGTCWAMSGISTLESFLIKKGIARNTIDLSEEHLVWWAMKQDDGYGWSNSDKNAGGYEIVTTGYYTSWEGPKSERDIPYNSSDSINRPENYYTAPTLYNVTDVIYLDNNEFSVKEAIKRYGAVNSMYCHEKKYLSSDEKSYCHSPYTEADNKGYHAISIVGWDDNYSRYNFTGAYRPSVNGAWLIKNSWGKDFGDDGFMWISYEDLELLMGDDVNVNYSVKKAKLPNENEKLYQLSPYGATMPIELNNPNMLSGKLEMMTVANVFDFEEDQRNLDYVMFMTDKEDQLYEIYYAPVENDKPVTDRNKMIYLASGKVRNSGYTTVKLKNQLRVPQGKGAIVINLDNRINAEGAAIGGECDIKYQISEYQEEYSFKALGKYDQSFFIINNKAYDAMDLFDGPLNFAIKVITNNH